MRMCRLPVKSLLALSIVTVLAAQDSVIRVNVSLVHAIATVRNRNGELVGSLQKEDFEILDNGVRQEVRVFGRQTEQPLSIALMLDTSGSVAKDFKNEVESAVKFLRALLADGNPQDQVALFRFSYDVNQGSFTHNYASLERMLRELEKSVKAGREDKGTSMYDAIFYAARALQDREGRKAIVVITDGGDTTSRRDMHQALKEAQIADAVVYPIVVMPITNDAGRNIGGEHALQFMAEGTGGKPFSSMDGTQLDRAFTDILNELRTQYLLGFYPQNLPATKDRFHKLEVRVKAPELRVSARNGYYGDAEGGSSTPGARTTVTPDRKKN
jgi:Ca-activated chloride channel family protein